MTTRIRCAPGERGCCDAAGRMVVMAYQPRTREQLIALAVAHNEGTREQIAARVDDLLASGRLIEVDEG